MVEVSQPTEPSLLRLLSMSTVVRCWHSVVTTDHTTKTQEQSVCMRMAHPEEPKKHQMVVLQEAERVKWFEALTEHRKSIALGLQTRRDAIKAGKAGTPGSLAEMEARAERERERQRLAEQEEERRRATMYAEQQRLYQELSNAHEQARAKQMAEWSKGFGVPGVGPRDVVLSRRYVDPPNISEEVLEKADLIYQEMVSSGQLPKPAKPAKPADPPPPLDPAAEEERRRAKRRKLLKGVRRS